MKNLLKCQEENYYTTGNVLDYLSHIQNYH